MKDQVDGLRVDGVAASYLNSTLLPHERDEVLASVREDRCRLLYVSPERIVGEGSQALRRLLQQADVRFIAIDEAHCISQWGHDFRPEYRQLGRLRDDFPERRRSTRSRRPRPSASGATSSRELRLQDPLVLVGSFDRPNLVYRVLRRGNLHSQLLTDPRAARGRSRHRLLLVAARGRGARRMAAGRRAQRGAVSRRPVRRGAEPAPGAVSRRARRHRRRHGGVRDGHRSLERALRRPRRRAAVARALPAGVGPRRPRRPAGRVRADLLGQRLRRAGGRCSSRTASGARARGRCCATWSATPRARAAGTARWSSTSAQPYERDGLRRVRLVPEGARSRSPTRRTLARKILSCVARVKQTWGIGARHRRPDRQGDREGRRRGARTSSRRSGC